MKTIAGCEHIKMFDHAIDMCQQELLIVSPWIIGGAARHLLNKLRKKNIRVTIMYGWHQDDENEIEQQANQLQNRFESKDPPLAGVSLKAYAEILEESLKRWKKLEGYGHRRAVLLCLFFAKTVLNTHELVEGGGFN